MYIWKAFICTDIVIDPEALELTNYVTQLSAFQPSLTELWEMTPDPTSESNKPLFEPRTECVVVMNVGLSQADLGWKTVLS